MGIKKNIKFGLYMLSLLMLSGNFLLSSCIQEELVSDTPLENNGTASAGTDTYYNFILHLADANQTRADSEAAGTDEENAIKNIAVILFDKDNHYETKSFFNIDNLVKEDGTGNLSNTATEGYTLKNVIPVTAGEKTVVAVVNCNSHVQTALNNLLGPDVTYEQFYNYQLSLLPTGAAYPARLDLPKYNNYEAPTPSGALDLSRLGIDGITPSETDGMLMTGVSTVTLDANATEQQVLSGQRNTVTIHVDRVAAKVSLKFAASVKKETRTHQSNNIFSNTFYEPDITTPIVSAEWWVANMPDRGYLMRHESEPKHPYYNQSSVFSTWQNNQLGTAARLEHDPHEAYMPENLVAVPVRGNATYLAIKAKFDLCNIEDRKDFSYSFKNPILPGHHIVLGAEYCNEDSSPGWNDLVYHYLPRGQFLRDNDVLLLIDEEGKRKYLMWNSMIHGNDGNNRVKWIESYFQYVYYQPNPPGIVKVSEMSSPSLLQADQDTVAFSRRTSIDPGWYGFYYDAKTVHSGKWYDEVFFYYYTGVKDDNGNWEREKEKKYTAALYKNGHCYYRINLRDKDGATLADRFAVNRNTWFDVEITKIKELGYPDEEDLAANPEHELTDAAIEVKISVLNWREGGRQNVVIGKE